MISAIKFFNNLVCVHGYDSASVGVLSSNQYSSAREMANEFFGAVVWCALTETKVDSDYLFFIGTPKETIALAVRWALPDFVFGTADDVILVYEAEK